MKKVFDIAIKDMLQSFRSMFAIMFMFVVPILMTGMFSLMLGGASDDQGLSLPITKVILVNQDSGQFSAGSTPDSGPSSIGGMLTTILQMEDFQSIMDVDTMPDADLAREAVDTQAAGVAVIIPKDTTENFLSTGTDSRIEMYQDPTLTIGPALIEAIIKQTLDNLSSSKIALEVTFQQLEMAAIPITDQMIQTILEQYAPRLQQKDWSAYTQDTRQNLIVREPVSGNPTESQSMGVVTMIMTGMSIFFVFFTGASGAQSILREEVKGTLPRLFTTPTTRATILTGKFLAVVLTILVQLSVLLLFGRLVFHIHWGGLYQILMISLGIAFAAAGFGIFLISWIKTERQAGAMIGGLVTIMGMMGMMPIFVASIPNPPRFINIISHLVPQGWAVEGLQLAMLEESIPGMLPNTLILLVWAVAFLLIGIFRFRTRYQ
jgi:ABC-type multidrug transport system permease subunit